MLILIMIIIQVAWNGRLISRVVDVAVIGDGTDHGVQSGPPPGHPRLCHQVHALVVDWIVISTFYMSRKKLPILYSKLLYKMGNYFLDI